MAKKNIGGMIGRWAFLIGVVLAVILGVVSPTISGVWVSVLVVLGLIIGFLNIADSEVKPFLMSGAVLIIAAALGQSVVESVPILSSIMNALLLIFVPSTVIVAIKNVFSLARH